MREVGSRIREMDLGTRGSRMEMFTKESITKAKCMVKASIFGPVASFTRGFGRLAIRKDMEFGRGLKMTLT